jgi:diguanylate cyclase (GGDEF)-like protein
MSLLQNTTILAIDDEPLNLMMLEDFLQHRCQQLWLETDINSALALAREQQPDVILLDILMGHMDGYQVCQQLKANLDTVNIPVIFLSTLARCSDKVKGFQVGGIDYISKPFHIEEVVARIENCVNLHRQIQQSQVMLAELHALNRKFEALSMTDALTGIANRRHFDTVLASEWNRALRLGQPLAVALLDIDWFKKYNDHYGHQAGDECLRNVANVFAATVCRTGDLVARYGGEEFVFIAPTTNGECALAIAKKVCAALQALALPHEMSDYGFITASIGVAAVIPRNHEDTSDRLLKAADDVLYHAKQQGRNQAILADSI